ncbi:MAG: C1 family peptidase [Clostridia bacterium]|nr:C1 family peptidase [Clostridia bacterium]
MKLLNKITSILLTVLLLLTSVPTLSSLAISEDDNVVPNVINQETESEAVSSKPLLYNPATDTLRSDLRKLDSEMMQGNETRVRQSSSSKVLPEASLPSSCDLRGTKYLPPITNQGDLGSCVSEANTYMQFSNAVARYVEANGIDSNWNPSKNKKYTFSPKWTYNLAGANVSKVYDALADHGAVTYDGYVFDEKKTGGHTKLPTQNNVEIRTEETMYSALKYRLKEKEGYDEYDMNSYSFSLTTTSKGRELLNTIKSAINQGNVVSTVAYPFRWIYTRTSKAGDIAKLGEHVIVTAQGEDMGRHCVAIVGYDDNVEAQFGSVTMKGAFLIANSWGASWKNKGYVWMMYDAVNQESQFTALNNSSLYKCGMNITIDGSLKVYSSTFYSESSNWQFTDKGSTTINGKSYRKYTIARSSGIDASIGPYITYSNMSPTSAPLLTIEPTVFSEWCMIPYSDITKFSGFDSANYNKDYLDTYWLCPANGDYVGKYFLDCGKQVTVQGRSIGMSAFNKGATPEAHSLTLSGAYATSQGQNFVVKMVAKASPVQKLQRQPALDLFCILYWDRDVTVDMPDLMLEVDAQVYDRDDINLKVFNSRIITEYYKPFMFEDIESRPFRGFSFSGVEAAKMTSPQSVKLYFNLDCLSLYSDKQYTDYTWGAKVYCDSVSGKPVNITGFKIISGKTNKVISGGNFSTAVKLSDGDSRVFEYSVSSNLSIKSTDKTTVSAKSGEDSITLTWTGVENADGYIVYRRFPGEKMWGKIATLSCGSAKGYVDKSCSAGKIYYYMVMPYSVSNNTYTYGAHSNQSNASALIGSSSLISVTEGNSGITLKWTSAKYANGYRVLKRKPKDTVWSVEKVLGNVTQYVCSNVSQAEEYYFTVQPLFTSGQYTVYGSFDAVGKIGYLSPKSNYIFKSGDVVTLSEDARLIDSTLINNALTNYQFLVKSVDNKYASLTITLNSKLFVNGLTVFDFLSFFGHDVFNTPNYQTIIDTVLSGRDYYLSFEISTYYLNFLYSYGQVDSDIMGDTDDFSVEIAPDSDTAFDDSDEFDWDSWEDITDETDDDVMFDVDTDEFIIDLPLITITTDLDNTSDSPTKEPIIYDFKVGDTVHLLNGSQLGDNDTIQYEGLVLDYRVVLIEEDAVTLRLDVNPELMKELDVDTEGMLSIIGCSHDSQDFDYSTYVSAITAGKGYSFYFMVPISSLTYEKPRTTDKENYNTTDTDFGFAQGDVVNLLSGASNLNGSSISKNLFNLDYTVLQISEEGELSLMINVSNNLLDNLKISLSEFIYSIGFEDLNDMDIEYEYAKEILEDNHEFSVVFTVSYKYAKKVRSASKGLTGDADCNGEVNMVDVTTIQKVIAMLSSFDDYGAMSNANADCDHSGEVNMQDVTLLQRFIAQLVSSL